MRPTWRAEMNTNIAAVARNTMRAFPSVIRTTQIVLPSVISSERNAKASAMHGISGALPKQKTTTGAALRAVMAMMCVSRPFERLS